MPTNLMKEDDVLLSDIYSDVVCAVRDVNSYMAKHQDFIIETATTVIEVALAIILFKLIVRVLLS